MMSGRLDSDLRMRPAAPHLWKRCLWLAVLLAGAGCGYRIQSSSGSLPEGIRSIGVPTFRNLSPQFKLEQRVTAALMRELSLRTRVPVLPAAMGVEAVLEGEILNYSSSPVTFGTNTFGSAFLVTVQMSVKLVRLRDSAVLLENNGFLFRERYMLNSKVTEFFSEDNPALDRLSRDFAASLVSTLLVH